MGGAGVTAILERIARFEQELCVRGIPFPGTTAPIPSPLHAPAAYVRSVYPPHLGGQTVLASDAEPTSIDDAIGGSEQLLVLSRRFDRRHSHVTPVWLTTERERPPRSLNRTLFQYQRPRGGSWAGKPAAGALFTSYGTRADLGMWHTYLLCHPEEAPRPWLAWRLTPSRDAKVYTIDSALEWCSFVSRYRSREAAHGAVAVDWYSVASEYSAVDVTLTATAAIDAIGFRHEGLSVAPSFWTVPTTVWLRWDFDDALPVAVPPEPE